MSTRKYLPAEVCRLFRISKSTLFRWEQTKVIPRAKRGERGERLYDVEHLTAISDRQAKMLAKRYTSATKLEDMNALYDVMESDALRKVIAGDVTGLYQLEELPKISEHTIRDLLRVANLENVPRNFLAEIIEVLWIHLRKPVKKDPGEPLQ